MYAFLTTNLNIVIKILVKVFFFLYNYIRKVDDYMNKKGFTLVELLAVIIILSLLGLLISTSVTKVVKDSKEDLYDTQIKLIKSAAEAWGADNLYDLPEAGNCKYLLLQDLKEYGLIDNNITNPKTNKLFSDNLIIRIDGKQNVMGLNNVTYEVDSTDIKDCEPIYNSLITEENDTTYPWNIVEGLYKSTNHNHNTTSNMTFKFKLFVPMVLKFDWSVSSESASYDYLYYTIKKDEQTLSGTGTSTKIGGISYGTSEANLTYKTVTKNLEPGEYELTFTYRKDSGGNSGTDTAYVKNIRFEDE